MRRDDEFVTMPNPVVNTYFRGPLIVIYDAIRVNPSWCVWNGAVNCQVTAHVEAAVDGSLRGALAGWHAHEVQADQVTQVNAPKSLGCRREEGMVLVITVRIRSDSSSNSKKSSSSKGSGNNTDPSSGSEPTRAFDATLTGKLYLDHGPLKLLETRSISLFDSRMVTSTTAVDDDNVNPLAAATRTNDALLLGDRGGELTLRFLPEPPRVKTIYWLRHAESEWNAAQRQGRVLKMVGQVDHPLAPTGVAQARALQRKVAATLRRMHHDEQLQHEQDATTAARVKAAVQRAKEHAKELAFHAEAAARRDVAAAKQAQQRHRLLWMTSSCSGHSSRPTIRRQANGSSGLDDLGLGSNGTSGDDEAFAVALLEELRTLRADALAAASRHSVMGAAFPSSLEEPNSPEHRHEKLSFEEQKEGDEQTMMMIGDEDSSQRLGQQQPHRLRRYRRRNPWEAAAMANLVERLSTHLAEVRAKVVEQRRNAALNHRHHRRLRGSSSSHSRSPSRGSGASSSENSNAWGANDSPVASIASTSSSGSAAAGAGAGGSSVASSVEAAAHLERRFLRATVLSSPLCRAVQTALLALGPSGHLGLATGGVTLLASAREVKKTRGSFDCAATTTGPAVRQRAVDLLAALPLPPPLTTDSAVDGDDASDVGLTFADTDCAQVAGGSASSPSKGGNSNNNNSSALRGTRRRRQAAAHREAARHGAAAAAEQAAVRGVAVHAGDAANAGCKWWTSGVDTTRDCATRVRELVSHLALLPDADLVVVGHSYLIREVFRTFAGATPDSSNDDVGVSSKGAEPHDVDTGSLRTSPVARELCDRKLENCGVVATRFDFGPLLPDLGGGESTNGSSYSGEGALSSPGLGLNASGGSKYITDAVYLFGSSACKDKAEKKQEKALEKGKQSQLLR